MDRISLIVVTPRQVSGERDWLAVIMGVVCRVRP